MAEAKAPPPLFFSGIEPFFVLVRQRHQRHVERLDVELFAELEFVTRSEDVVRFVIGRDDVVDRDLAVVEAGARGFHGHVVDGVQIDGGNARFFAGYSLMIDQNQSPVRQNERVAHEPESHVDGFLGHEIGAVLVLQFLHRHFRIVAEQSAEQRHG